MTGLIVAIDTSDMNRAMQLTRDLRHVAGGYKFGLEFFISFGLHGIEKLIRHGKSQSAIYRANVMIDLKYHDIPATVGAVVKRTAALQPRFITVHASGGMDMIKAARDATGDAVNRPQILAVTVLTSLSDEDLAVVGVPHGTSKQVERLAHMAYIAGADGFVCSAVEAKQIRHILPASVIVCPGIRQMGDAYDDQERVATPTEAVEAGADWIVVGRPITQTRNPLQAAESIRDEMLVAHRSPRR